jgi:hypothetical protein
MAESIFDGDDLVGQFAQFLPASDPPAPAKPAVLLAGSADDGKPPTPVNLLAPSASAAEPAVQLLAAAQPPLASGQGVPWGLLVVPGSALLAAAIWFVARHRRARKASS